MDEIDDDNGNDTDIVIDEDIIEKKDTIMLQVELKEELVDEDDDIPLLQIKHGERSTGPVEQILVIQNQMILIQIHWEEEKLQLLLKLFQVL